MDPESTQLAIELAKNLAVSTAKAASGAVYHKVQLAKQKKNIEDARQAYEDIINELLQDNTDLVSTAQAYKAKLDQVEISDEDIKALHATVDKILDIFKTFAVMDANAINSFEKMKQMLTADTLRTLQLLGFNYRDAIGRPLTQICRDAILKWGGAQQSKHVVAKNGHNQRNR